MSFSRETVILMRLSEMISFAEYLPLEMLTERNTEPKYPVTIGEHVVNYALDIVLRHEWESSDNEYMAEPLLNALHQLDAGVDKPEVWKDLFRANAELTEYLRNLSS